MADIRDLYLGMIDGRLNMVATDNSRMQKILAGRDLRVIGAGDADRLDFLAARFYGGRLAQGADLENFCENASGKIVSYNEWQRDPNNNHFRDALLEAAGGAGRTLNRDPADPATVPIGEVVGNREDLLLDLSAETVSAAMQFHCSGLPNEAKVIARKTVFDAAGGSTYQRRMDDVAAVIDAMLKPVAGPVAPILSFPYFDKRGRAVAITIDTANGSVFFNSSAADEKTRAETFADFKDSFAREVIPSLVGKFGFSPPVWEVGVQEVPVVTSSVSSDELKTSGVHCVLNGALDLVRVQATRGQIPEDEAFDAAKRKICDITGCVLEDIEGDNLDEVLRWVGSNVFESQVPLPGGGELGSREVRDACDADPTLILRLNLEAQQAVREACVRQQDLQKRIIVAAEVIKHRSTLFAECNPLRQSERGVVAVQGVDIDGVAAGLDPASHNGHALGGGRARYQHRSDFEMTKEICAAVEREFLALYHDAVQNAEDLRRAVGVVPGEDQAAEDARKDAVKAAEVARDRLINQAFVFGLLREGYKKAEESHKALAAQAAIDPSFVLCDDKGNALQTRAAVNAFFAKRALQFIPKQYHDDATAAMGFVETEIDGRWEVAAGGLAGQDVDDFARNVTAACAGRPAAAPALVPGAAPAPAFVPTVSCAPEFLALRNPVIPPYPPAHDPAVLANRIHILDAPDLVRALQDRARVVADILVPPEVGAPPAPRDLAASQQVLNHCFHSMSELVAQGAIRCVWAVETTDNGPVIGVNPLDGMPFCTPKNDSRNFTIIVPAAPAAAGGQDLLEEKMIRFETNGDVLVFDPSATGPAPKFTSADTALLQEVRSIINNPSLAQERRTQLIHQNSKREGVAGNRTVMLSVAPDTSYAMPLRQERRLADVNVPGVLPSDASFGSVMAGAPTTLTIGPKRRLEQDAKKEQERGGLPEKIVLRGNEFALRAGSEAEHNRHLFRNAEFLRTIFDGTNNKVDFGDADITHASFRGCEFQGRVDFSRVDREVFKTISFANCKGLENIICPTGMQLFEGAIGAKAVAVVARADDIPHLPPGTAVAHPVAVPVAGRTRAITAARV